MSRFIYSQILYLAIPLIILRLLWRSLRAPAYLQRWGERFAFSSPPLGLSDAGPCIWIHAVSVGEVLAAVPLVRHLQQSRPQQPILVTTMTPTGSERVRQALGDQVFHCYLPYDLPLAVQRFVRRANPLLLVIMETELWPNLIHACRQAAVPVLLANARLSARSARGYARFPGLTGDMLAGLQGIAVQAEPDRERLLALGAEAGRIEVTGSLKFDIEVPRLRDEDLPELLRDIRHSGRPVWIAASTRQGEEEKILTALQHCLASRPDLLLVLVPRHPERFNSVARLCEQTGLQVLRRSQGGQVTQDHQVLLGDSMGEMWFYYSVAQIAFVGGSLVPNGCHNVLEPAALGIPVLAGPSQFNFATICQQLEEAGALLTVADEDELGKTVLKLLDNPDWRQAMGSAGQLVMTRNHGALQRIVSIVEGLLPA
ncbi:MAG: hypothetical protein RLZZ385_2669 [Pseudomonadota bacterium]|jgi:3-deoxy-D-manno-octulosonic-acid transferase